MKQLILYFGLLGLSFLNISLILKSKNDSKLLKIQNTKIENISSELFSYHKEWFKSDSIELISNNQEVPSDILLRRRDGSYINLETIINDKKIVIRLSELTCTSCYQKSFINLSDYLNNIGKENFVIISKHNNVRDLYAYMRSNNLNCEVYNLEDQTLGLPIEASDLPFIFLLDDSFIARDLFLVRKELPELTNVYFDYISKYFYPDFTK